MKKNKILFTLIPSSYLFLLSHQKSLQFLFIYSITYALCVPCQICGNQIFILFKLLLITFDTVITINNYLKKKTFAYVRYLIKKKQCHLQYIFRIFQKSCINIQLLSCLQSILLAIKLYVELLFTLIYYIKVL